MCVSVCVHVRMCVYVRGACADVGVGGCVWCGWETNQRIVRERRALVSLTVPQSEQRREANVLRISPPCVGEPRVPPASPTLRAR